MLSQIQPHFLYNVLNSIENLVSKDPEQAEELIRDFATYLRENMDSLKQKQLIPFERELKHIQTYLHIEQARFQDRLHICYDFEVTDFDLPILTVQPLVENAVRYGITRKTDGGTVTIPTRMLENSVLITVTDDGIGFDSSEEKHDGRSHIGIENVKERLVTQCKGTLTVESVVGKGTIARVEIPSFNVKIS